MKKTRKKNQIIIFLIILFIFCVLAQKITAQGRPLEVDYPTIKGIKPTQTDFELGDYIKYIFYFIIISSGIIALTVLIWQGFQYLTSTGQPEKMNEAKKRIKLALVGTLILFFSYLILTTINPELIVLQLPSLEPLSEIPEPQQEEPLKEPVSKLERIREIALGSAKIAELLDDSSKTLKSLIDNCNCKEVQAMCICGSGSGQGSISVSGNTKNENIEESTTAFKTGSLSGDFNETLNTLSNFQKSNTNVLNSFLPTGSSLNSLNNQLNNNTFSLFSEKNIKIGNNQFSDSEIKSLSSSVQQATNFFGSSYQDIINNSSVYILNNSNYQSVINDYINQVSNQGLIQNQQQKNLLSSQLLNSVGAYIYNGEEYLMVINGNKIINSGTEGFIKQFSSLIDASHQALSSSPEYLKIFKQSQENNAFVNNYAKIGGAAADFSESLAAYYKDSTSFLSTNKNNQSLFQDRLDYFKKEGIIKDL